MKNKKRRVPIKNAIGSETTLDTPPAKTAAEQRPTSQKSAGQKKRRFSSRGKGPAPSATVIDFPAPDFSNFALPAGPVIGFEEGVGGFGRFPKPDKNSILVCPVGGVGLIGMNWTLYGHDGRWILVDAGTAFIKDVPGYQMMFPDPAALRSILGSLDGLLITHAHEDHIGAVHHIVKTLRCTVHATPFAAEILKTRFEEVGVKARVSLFKPGSTFQIGPFAIRTINVTHSTAECVAMAISTPAGTVFHTGDWKFDSAPVIGPVTDMKALKDTGDAGVLAMLCDSTNALREAPFTSETTVQKNLIEVARRVSGAVVVSCFATNVARLVSIGAAAAASGRKVGLIGRSLERIDDVARTVGILGDDDVFLADPRHLQGLNKSEMMIVCTGTQGEERAALSRLARGAVYYLPRLGLGDVVIHSARAIPGNEEAIDLVMDRFRGMGVDVLMGADGEADLHVTGHASRGELREMYQLIRPLYALPVHGTPGHMEAHAALALETGSTYAGLSLAGDVWRVSAEGIARVARVTIPHVAVSDTERNALVPWSMAENRPLISAASGRRPQTGEQPKQKRQPKRQGRPPQRRRAA